MTLLHLTQHAEGDATYRVEIALERAGMARETASASLPFELTPQDVEVVTGVEGATAIPWELLTRLDTIDSAFVDGRNPS